ncbi:MAG TPA: hypothetical protein GXZ87_02630 [Bacteroidales bacterium]|nr:hypothetical protein [Bacteroidales bacterium]
MKKKFVAISVIFGFFVFIGIAVITKLFSTGDLPIQITGALLESVVTALITYFLLTGQTTQEENKERNVKVFEKKTENFNNFIEQLWTVWDDRSISLEELNDLLKLVSKDIIPFAKPENSSAILFELNKIAEVSISSNNENSVTKKIQQSIFSIINVLSKEIGLGGEINEEINKEFDSLENRILPFLNKKSYINQLKELVKSKSMNMLSDFEMDDDSVLWWKIGKNTGVWLRVGDIYKNGTIFISFWSEFYENRKYQPYRYAQKGEWKDWLKNEYKGVELLDYNDLRQGNIVAGEKIEELANKIVEFYNTTKIDGKTIDEIIEVV